MSKLWLDNVAGLMRWDHFYFLNESLMGDVQVRPGVPTDASDRDLDSCSFYFLDAAEVPEEPASRYCAFLVDPDCEDFPRLFIAKMDKTECVVITNSAIVDRDAKLIDRLKLAVTRRFEYASLELLEEIEELLPGFPASLGL